MFPLVIFDSPATKSRRRAWL